MKQITILLLMHGILTGCASPVEPSNKKESRAQKTIQNNRTEAQNAQEEYKKLQKAHAL